mmetsp:Transcript_7549/g.18520  ORF Transcript_7549/g.18520 Transcript_7549/m.18520 type:complete len:318 (+) Transcript_7549:42-995(+)
MQWNRSTWSIRGSAVTLDPTVTATVSDGQAAKGVEDHARERGCVRDGPDGKQHDFQIQNPASQGASRHTTFNKTKNRYSPTISECLPFGESVTVHVRLGHCLVSRPVDQVPRCLHHTVLGTAAHEHIQSLEVACTKNRQLGHHRAWEGEVGRARSAGNPHGDSRGCVWGHAARGYVWGHAARGWRATLPSTVAVDSVSDTLASASSPVLVHIALCLRSQTKFRPPNSLIQRASNPQRITEIFGIHQSSWGVFSSVMLKPLKMIISTMTGGRRARAASEDGATAPRSSPRAEEANEWRVVMPRKVMNLGPVFWSPTRG